MADIGDILAGMIEIQNLLGTRKTCRGKIPNPSRSISQNSEVIGSQRATFQGKRFPVLAKMAGIFQGAKVASRHLLTTVLKLGTDNSYLHFSPGTIAHRGMNAICLNVKHLWDGQIGREILLRLEGQREHLLLALLKILFHLRGNNLTT